MNLRHPLFAVRSRSRAAGLLLVAALVMATAATTLVAVVPLYADAIAQAGFERTLSDAEPVERSVVLSTRAPSSEVESITSAATSTTESRLPGTIRVLASGTSRDFRLDPDRFGDASIASIGTLVTDESMVEVIEGLPAAAAGEGRLPVSLAVSAATALGIGVGDRLELDGRADGIIGVEVVALIQPVDRFDDLWLDRPEFRDGVRTVGNSRSFGPFLVDAEAFAALDLATTVTWRAVVEPSSLTPADIVEVRTAARRIDSALTDALPTRDIDVATGLPELLAATDTALGSSEAVIAVILLQIVGLSLYGLGLASSVLSSSRLVEASLLRSRGATAQQVGALAGAEALLVVIPAAVAGPVLAQGVVMLIEQWGPVRASGLDLDPNLSKQAVFASLAVAVVSIGVIVWPAVRSARALSEAKSERTRASRPAALQRSGADIVIAALAVAGLWQLTRSSAATRDLSGRLGTDPILVLAPTLGVVAASLITLRLISVFAAAIQQAAAGRTGLSTALAGWELARRPDRTARTSVLVVLAVTIGTFAAVQGASWDRSQRDQADATVSADIVVRADLRPNATVSDDVLADALHELNGVDDVVPFDRPTATLAGDLSNLTVVALDTASADGVLRLREDLRSDVSIDQLRQPVDLHMVPLGSVDGDLTMTLGMNISGGTVDDGLQVAVVLLDGHGSLHRVEADAVPVRTSTVQLTFPLTSELTLSLDTGTASDDSDGTRLARMAGPVGLVRIDVIAPIVNDVEGAESPKAAAVFDLEFGDVMVGRRSVDLGARNWNTPRVAQNNNTLQVGTLAAESVDGGLAVAFDTGLTEQSRARLTGHVATSPFAAGAAASGELPALVTPALLDGLELALGDVAVGRIGGTSIAVRLVGIIPAVPFAVHEQEAMLVDWSTLSVERYVVTGRFESPTEYALAVGADQADEVGRALSVEPFSAISIVDRRELARSLADDPFAIGLFGSLALALAGSLLVAIVGLLLAAVVGARERRTAYSVLRAMGTPTRVLRRWLLLEVVPLVAVSALAGLVAGILLARTALTALTVTSEGVLAVPAPRLVIPWANVGLVVGVALVAGVIVPLLTGRLLGRNDTAADLRIGDSA